MKKIPLIILLGIGCGIFSVSAQNKYRSVADPSFSVDNYKHPNKAAAARKRKPYAPVRGVIV